jgi:SHS2 domain-containing protein
MAYSYLDHEADMGIRAEGESVEEAFCEGAKAMFNVMADIKEVKAIKKVEVHCESDSIPKLFIEWLNELLSLADMETLLLSEFKIDKIKTEEALFVIDGQAFGEGISPERHRLKTEVKAATYSGLRYEVKGKRHILQCVVDL